MYLYQYSLAFMSCGKFTMYSIQSDSLLDQFQLTGRETNTNQGELYYLNLDKRTVVIRIMAETEMLSQSLKPPARPITLVGSTFFFKAFNLLTPEPYRFCKGVSKIA